MLFPGDVLLRRNDRAAVNLNEKKSFGKFKIPKDFLFRKNVLKINNRCSRIFAEIKILCCQSK